MVKSIQDNYPDAKVDAVYMEEMSFKEQIELMKRTTIMIAVHGSGMSNIIFLPKDASVIEIFPFGFERPTYEFLARNIGINYVKWKNPEKKNTKFHPEVLKSFQLTENQIKEITEASSFRVDMPWAGNMYNYSSSIIVHSLLGIGLRRTLSSMLNYLVLL